MDVEFIVISAGRVCMFINTIQCSRSRSRRSINDIKEAS
jgi:hypothetical protein